MIKSRWLGVLRLAPGWLRRRIAESMLRKWLRSRGASEALVLDFLKGYRTKLGAIVAFAGGIGLIGNGILHDFNLEMISQGVTALGVALAQLGIRFANGAK